MKSSICVLFLLAVSAALPAQARPRASLLERADAGLGAVRLTQPLESSDSPASDVGLRVASLEPGSLMPLGFVAATGGEARGNTTAVSSGLIIGISTLLCGAAGGITLAIIGAAAGGYFGPLLALLGAIVGTVAGLAVGALVGGLIAAGIALGTSQPASTPAAAPPPPAKPDGKKAPKLPPEQEPSISITPLFGASLDGHGVLGGFALRF
jgi:hypothetical protein